MALNKDFYREPPVGEHAAAEAAKEIALRKAGIDPRTDEEKRKAREDLERARKWWGKTGGEL